VVGSSWDIFTAAARVANNRCDLPSKKLDVTTFSVLLL
jgi:hypothetical protein